MVVYDLSNRDIPFVDGEFWNNSDSFTSQQIKSVISDKSKITFLISQIVSLLFVNELYGIYVDEGM